MWGATTRRAILSPRRLGGAGRGVGRRAAAGRPYEECAARVGQGRPLAARPGAAFPLCHSERPLFVILSRSEESVTPVFVRDRVTPSAACGGSSLREGAQGREIRILRPYGLRMTGMGRSASLCGARRRPRKVRTVTSSQVSHLSPRPCGQVSFAPLFVLSPQGWSALWGPLGWRAFLAPLPCSSSPVAVASCASLILPQAAGFVRSAAPALPAKGVPPSAGSPIPLRWARVGPLICAPS